MSTVKPNSVITFDLSNIPYSNIRTSGCLIMICTEGLAIVSINFMKYRLRQGDAVVIMPELCFSVVEVIDRCLVQIVSLSEDVIEQTQYKMASSQLLDFIYIHPIIPVNPIHLPIIEDWFKQIEWILHYAIEGYKRPLLSNSFFNLAMGIDSIISNSEKEKFFSIRNRSWVLCGQYCTLVVKNCHQNHDVGFYANKMHITPEHLYKVIMNVTKMSPKEIIDLQILSEIKILLSETDMVIKEIAQKLGFEDPSYMCRFFRRMTGMSTREFKQSVK